MMANYDTYREAVLANGSTKGVVTTCEYWTGSPWFEGKFTFETKHERPAVGEGKWVKCNPADYLETLESFLASGKRLADGDRYIENDGEVVPITSDGDEKSVSEFAINTPRKGDENLFILQAAADQVETPEEKEAFDSIPNQTTIDSMNSEDEKESYNSASEAYDAIDTTMQQVESTAKAEWKNGGDCLWKGKEAKIIGLMPSHPSRMIVEVQDALVAHVKIAHVEDLEKPETPAEREERERLEAAYDLYLTARESTNDYTITFNQFCDSMVKARFLAIVDKTGYRKQ